MAKRKPLISPYPFLSIFIFIFFCSNTIADENGYLLKLSKSLSSTPSDWSGSDPCKWSGINCESGSVTSIDLSSKSLTGSIPSDLNQLTKLLSVSFQNNQITGPLPNFSNLTSLKSIYLNTNNFTSVPDSIFYGLPSLQTLSLSDNLNLSPWVFPQDLAQSDSLDSIYADSVNLMGQIPDFVGSLLSLQNLRLSYNNLTGVLPSSLAGSDIRNIWVNNQLMGLSGSIDVLGTMTQVSQVWFHKNLFTGSIPDLSNCTSIFDLQLRDNFLAGVVPPSLISLPQLVNVSLANNKLQGPYPDFKPGVLVNIGAQNSFCNPKPGPCDPQVMTLLEIAGALSYPKSLADSWVGNNACAGDWVGILCDPQAKNVTVLNFGKRHFGGTISPAISKLTSLKNLLLNDNNLTGSIPSSLTSLTELQIIDVTNNNLSGKVPEFSSKVNLKPNGNPLLGTELPPSGDPSSNKSTSADQSGRHKSSAVSAGMVAGIIIAVLIFMGVVFLVGYKYYTKKHHGNFGSLESPISGKELVKNSEVGTSGRNGYGGVANELTSQSSGDTSARYFEGGNVTISIEVIRQVTDNFSENNILGRGGFGIVYKGELHDGTQIAVKRMESNLMGTKGLNEFQAEIAVLTKVRHRHLVALLGFCVNGNERLLVYEYMPQGTLSQHLFDWNNNGGNPLTWKQRVSIALDVARGVEYLHSLAQQSFIHRDLKPTNILLGNDMRAKVADFGLVKNAPDGKYSLETRLAGTFGYLAPEYAATGRVTRKVDVYAYGVVLMEILTGRKALDENLPDEQSHLVTWFRRVLINKNNIIKAIDPTLDPDEETFANITTVAELAGHCTARDPTQRPEMGHAVNILGPLVEQWKPSRHEEEEAYGVDLHMSLPQALQRWQDEGTSTMTSDFYSRTDTSLGNTQTSIPSRPNGFPDTFNSANCR